MTFAATENAPPPWSLNTQKKRLRLKVGRIFGVLRAKETCLLAANVVLLRWES